MGRMTCTLAGCVFGPQTALPGFSNFEKISNHFGESKPLGRKVLQKQPHQYLGIRCLEFFTIGGLENGEAVYRCPEDQR
jgi:hypothetical protein